MSTRLLLIGLIVGLMFLTLPASVYAACIGGTTFVPALADGRIIGPVTVTPGNTVAFFYYLRGPRSFSVEVRKQIFGTVGTIVTTSPAFSCANIAGLRDTTEVEPSTFIGNNVVFRASFTTTNPSLTFFETEVQNPAGGVSFDVTFTISETTMFNPAWSTFGGFATFYSFNNTTGALINGTLTVVDNTGMTVATANLSIPAGGNVSTNTIALGVAANKFGTARFTHDGPPGAVIAEAAIANFSVLPFIIQAAKFLPVREVR